MSMPRIASRALLLALLANRPTAAGELPRPLFYLPLDDTPAAAIAGGSATPQAATGADAILALVDRSRPRLRPGKVGGCHDLADAPLVFRCKGNFRADEGTAAFWLNPRFRGDDKNIYCTFFGAADWGMVYKYLNQSTLTFGTAKPERDLYYDCTAPDITDWGPGTWHHVAITWSRAQNSRRIYLDGAPAAEGPFPFHRPVEDGPLFIGSGCTLYPGHVAHADMDEVAIWDQPFAADLVKQLHELGTQGKPLWIERPARQTEAKEGELNEVVPETAIPEQPAPATQSFLSLNGTWHVLPATEALAELPVAGWGTSRVPGYWAAPGTTHEADGGAVYYQCRFATPVGWQGKEALLAFGGVDGLAEIFLNGRHLAWLPGWEDETYDVGRRLRPGGQHNTLVVALHASGSSSVGIYGDVSLRAVPGACVLRPAVATSVTEHRLGVSCDLWNPGPPTEAELVFDIRPANAPDKPSRRFVHRFRLEASSRSAAGLSATTQRVTCEFPWPDARLWTYDAPFLYRLETRLIIPGQQTSNAPTVRFGFREFSVRGSEFLLNGVPTHLRGHQIDLGWSDQMDRLRELRDAGMNCFEFSGPKSHTWYGTHPYRLAQFEQALDYADENGLVAIPVLPGASQLKERIFEPEVARLYRQRLDKHVRRFGNHPSACLWFMHFNLAGYRWYIAPDKIDGSYKPDNPAFLAKERYSLEAERLLRQIDERPLYHHACGNFGGIFSLNCYIGPTSPLQEREEWPSHWAKTRPFPLLACEHGLLLVPYWFRPRKFPLSEVYADEPIFDELTAKYLGRRAYDLLTPELFDLYDMERNKPRGSRTRALVRQHPGYQEVKSLFARHSLRSWRTYGVSGVIFNAINWDFKDSANQPLPVMEALARYFGDTDLYLAGPQDDWPNKDHAFYSGETIAKQAVLLNDLTRDLPVTLDWCLRDTAGTVAAAGTLTGLAQGGKATMLPFSFPAPAVETRSSFRLEVVARPPQDAHFRPDSFALEVFPPERPSVPRASVLLFDPVGDTAQVLKRAGLATRPLDRTSDLSETSLLIVGTRSYTEAFTALAGERELDRAIRNGLNVLIFEQTSASPYSLELKEQSARRVFVASPGHPILAGLAAEDFLDLRGHSTLIPPYPEAPPETQSKWPQRFFKMSNRGVVASYVYTKPHYAPFVPILECGFDLVDSPLMEARIGAGRVVLCQVDVTSRYGTDPVSTRLVHNLLASLCSRREVRLPGLSCADTSAQAFLRRFGIEPRTTGNPSLIVVGKDTAPTQEEALAAAASDGATILLLPGSPSLFGLRTAEKRLYIGRPMSHSPLLAGISAADLYLKRWHTMPVCLPEDGWQLLVEPGLLATKPIGKGRVVACTLDPEEFAGTRAFPKALRFWNLLLANVRAPRPETRIAEGKAYEQNPWETIPGYINW